MAPLHLGIADSSNAHFPCLSLFVAPRFLPVLQMPMDPNLFLTSCLLASFHCRPLPAASSNPERCSLRGYRLDSHLSQRLIPRGTFPRFWPFGHLGLMTTLFRKLSSLLIRIRHHPDFAPALSSLFSLLLPSLASSLSPNAGYSSQALPTHPPSMASTITSP